MEAIIFERRAHTRQMAYTTTVHTTLPLTSAETVFEQVFKEHFKNLYAYACTILHDDVMAEEMVQQVFCRLWEKNRALKVEQSITAYLYRSVYHECLNYLKHMKVRSAHQQYVMKTGSESMQPSESTSLKELESRLEKALKTLPEQCRTIFQMSRFEELKYQEIADRLGLSIKTVENQMGKALKILRTQLADFLPAALIFLLLTF